MSLDRRIVVPQSRRFSIKLKSQSAFIDDRIIIRRRCRSRVNRCRLLLAFGGSALPPMADTDGAVQKLPVRARAVSSNQLKVCVRTLTPGARIAVTELGMQLH